MWIVLYSRRMPEISARNWEYVLFQIVLHSVIAEEEGIFTLEDVVMGVMNKMKYRHPKVFSPEDKEAVALSWEELKRREKTLTS